MGLGPETVHLGGVGQVPQVGTLAFVAPKTHGCSQRSWRKTAEGGQGLQGHTGRSTQDSVVLGLTLGNSPGHLGQAPLGQAGVSGHLVPDIQSLAGRGQDWQFWLVRV